MRILREPVDIEEVRQTATEYFGDFLKAVVDIGRDVMIIGGDLHADEEAALLDDGGAQVDLWGINLYPDRSGDEFIEFDSMINVRPNQGNRSRGVDDPELRRRISAVVERLVRR